MPGAVIELNATIVGAGVSDQALLMCQRYLPGLRTPDNVAAQLAHIANQGLQTQQLINNTSMNNSDWGTLVPQSSLNNWN